MATNARGKPELAMQKREVSPERNIVWVERKSNNEQKVPVVYYLSRDGRLEHPLSSPQGLFLKDVINKLNTLRGDGMANRFSWSSKRSYRNGYVWEDLLENDFIYPCHGREYILKGSLLLETSLSFRSYETVSSASSISKNSSETFSLSKDSDVEKTRRKPHSWSEFKELNEDERIIFMAKTSRELISKRSSVSTQTDDHARQGRFVVEIADEHEMVQNDSHASRQSSNSNSEILKGLNISADIRDQSVINYPPSGRIKASAVLMQLIACGSRRVKD